MAANGSETNNAVCKRQFGQGRISTQATEASEGPPDYELQQIQCNMTVRWQHLFLLLQLAHEGAADGCGTNNAHCTR